MPPMDAEPPAAAGAAPVAAAGGASCDWVARAYDAHAMPP
eukprot:gene5171-14742_t